MSLAVRLRVRRLRDDPNLCDEAADALDAKDAEIARLREALSEALQEWAHCDHLIMPGEDDLPRIRELRKLVKA